jgi:hypothetical protein
MVGGSSVRLVALREVLRSPSFMVEKWSVVRIWTTAINARIPSIYRTIRRRYKPIASLKHKWIFISKWIYWNHRFDTLSYFMATFTSYQISHRAADDGTLTSNYPLSSPYNWIKFFSSLDSRERGCSVHSINYCLIQKRLGNSWPFDKSIDKRKSTTNFRFSRGWKTNSHLIYAFVHPPPPPPPPP